MKIKKTHIIGIAVALIVMALNLIFLYGEETFYFLLGIVMVVGGLPFIISIVLENNREKENNQMFLEFSRDLIENVKAGTPVSKSILNVREKYYGSLTPYVKKLANQISVGIPVQKALEVFAKDVDSRVVKRAVSLIGEAEKAGGEIENILESVTESVNETEKLKKERSASVSSLIVQGYIIFLIFVVIMLIMQFKILPAATEVSEISTDIGSFSFGGSAINEGDIARPLLILLLTQGVFAGLVIGKLAEGKIKYGVKHSFILVTLSLLIYTGVNVIF